MNINNYIIDIILIILLVIIFFTKIPSFTNFTKSFIGKIFFVSFILFTSLYSIKTSFIISLIFIVSYGNHIENTILTDDETILNNFFSLNKTYKVLIIHKANNQEYTLSQLMGPHFNTAYSIDDDSEKLRYYNESNRVYIDSNYNSCEKLNRGLAVESDSELADKRDRNKTEEGAKKLIKDRRRKTPFLFGKFTGSRKEQKLLSDNPLTYELTKTEDEFVIKNTKNINDSIPFWALLSKPVYNSENCSLSQDIDNSAPKVASIILERVSTNDEKAQKGSEITCVIRYGNKYLKFENGKKYIHDTEEITKKMYTTGSAALCRPGNEFKIFDNIGRGPHKEDEMPQIGYNWERVSNSFQGTYGYQTKKTGQVQGEPKYRYEKQDPICTGVDFAGQQAREKQDAYPPNDRTVFKNDSGSRFRFNIKVPELGSYWQPNSNPNDPKYRTIPIEASPMPWYVVFKSNMGNINKANPKEWPNGTRITLQDPNGQFFHDNWYINHYGGGYHPPSWGTERVNFIVTQHENNNKQTIKGENYGYPFTFASLSNGNYYIKFESVNAPSVKLVFEAYPPDTTVQKKGSIRPYQSALTYLPPTTKTCVPQQDKKIFNGYHMIDATGYNRPTNRQFETKMITPKCSNYDNDDKPIMCSKEWSNDDGLPSCSDVCEPTHEYSKSGDCKKRIISNYENQDILSDVIRYKNIYKVEESDSFYIPVPVDTIQEATLVTIRFLNGKVEKPDLVVPDLVVPDPVVPDPAVPDPVVPEPAVPDPVVPDPVVPDPVVSKPTIHPLDFIKSMVESVFNYNVDKREEFTEKELKMDVFDKHLSLCNKVYECDEELDTNDCNKIIKDYENANKNSEDNKHGDNEHGDNEDGEEGFTINRLVPKFSNDISKDYMRSHDYIKSSNFEADKNSKYNNNLL